jgi:cation diffusion facilitator family transporter
MKNDTFLAYITGWVSVMINVLLFALKYWAGIVSGSVAMLADAWHTLSDSLSSLVVIVGTRISSIPPDKDHPFGHGRANLIAAVVIGVLLAVIAFNFFKESIEKLVNREVANFGTLAIVVTSISMVLKEALARFSFWSSKKANNRALKADAWHHRSDAISSAVILVGIFLGKYYWWIDGVLGILVTILLFHAAYEAIMEGVNPLLGETPNNKIITRLKSIANDITGHETHLHHVHLHRYGDHVEITLHIKLPKDTILEDAHDIATNIEETIAAEMNMEATIHMEPLFDEDPELHQKLD